MPVDASRQGSAPEDRMAARAGSGARTSRERDLDTRRHARRVAHRVTRRPRRSGDDRRRDFCMRYSRRYAGNFDATMSRGATVREDRNRRDGRNGRNGRNGQGSAGFGFVRLNDDIVVPSMPPAAAGIRPACERRVRCRAHVPDGFDWGRPSVRFRFYRHTARNCTAIR